MMRLTIYMTWQQKADFIQKDPVTCARNFQHMVQLFINDLLKSNLMSIGEIVDYSYRFSFNFLFFNINLQYYLQYTLLTILKLTTPLITLPEIKVPTTRFIVTVLTNLTLSTIPRVKFQHRGSPTCISLGI